MPGRRPSVFDGRVGGQASTTRRRPPRSLLPALGRPARRLLLADVVPQVSGLFRAAGGRLLRPALPGGGRPANLRIAWMFTETADPFEDAGGVPPPPPRREVLRRRGLRLRRSSASALGRWPRRSASCPVSCLSSRRSRSAPACAHPAAFSQTLSESLQNKSPTRPSPSRLLKPSPARSWRVSQLRLLARRLCGSGIRRGGPVPLVLPESGGRRRAATEGCPGPSRGR